MKVKELIDYLNNIEDKEQRVHVANYDFEIQADIMYAVEIKSASDKTMYFNGVSLLANI